VAVCACSLVLALRRQREVRISTRLLGVVLIIALALWALDFATTYWGTEGFDPQVVPEREGNPRFVEIVGTHNRGALNAWMLVNLLVRVLTLLPLAFFRGVWVVTSFVSPGELSWAITDYYLSAMIIIIPVLCVPLSLKLLHPVIAPAGNPQLGTNHEDER